MPAAHPTVLARPRVAATASKAREVHSSSKSESDQSGEAPLIVREGGGAKGGMKERTEKSHSLGGQVS